MSDHHLLRDDRNDAVFGADPETGEERRYRYRLWRAWNANLPTAVFVLLNPSTADETSNDDTVTKCINYAKRWGYGRLELVNLFALRATHPEDLYEHPNPIGPENNDYIIDVCGGDSFVVAGWGIHGELENRGPEVATMLSEHDVSLYAIGTTQAGHPWHPSRKPDDLDPEPYDRTEVE